MLLTYIWLAVAIVAFVLYLRETISKFSKLGVNHTPAVPILGHLAWVFLRQEHFIEATARNVNSFPNDKIIGQYELLNAVYVISDIEVVKRIAVKDFEHFVDRRGFVDSSDPLFGRGLLMLKGDEWKAMRSTLSPAFTSSKIKLMVPFMVEVGEEMIKVLKRRIKESGKVYIDVEGKDLATRYACDVIASCAFGLKVDSQSSNNQFYNMSLDITTFSFMRFMKIFTFRLFPRLAKLLKLQLVSSEASQYFKEVIIGTMINREKNGIIRNDMINILLEVKKGQLCHETKEGEDSDAGFATVEESALGKKQHDIKWTDNDLMAQASLFLFAGFETVSTAMSFLLHELALNPDVQDRLAEEIKEHHKKNNGNIDYNSIQNMTYLDMVVSEGIRLWPAPGITDRKCVKDYNAGRPNNTATKDLIIRRGESVMIPIWIFHRNPALFPNPEKFDPERFSKENRANIKPFSYMPFGVGPRNCIGSRFALCELKVMLYQLLLEMEVYPSERTCFPTKLSRDGLNFRIRDGAWLRFRIRSNSSE